MEYSLLRNPEHCGDALNGEASIRPALRVCADAVDLDCRNAPAGAQEPNVLALERAATGRHKSFAVQNRSDLLVHLAGRIEIGDAPLQSIKVKIVSVRVNPPLDEMFAGRAGLPNDLEPDLALQPLLIKHDLPHDESQNALPVGRRRGGGMPDSRQVLAEGLQPCVFRHADNGRFFQAPAGMLLLDRFDGAQLLFPGAFQRAGDEPVLGLDRIVLATRPLGLVASPFSPERPLPLQLPVLFRQLLDRRQRDRDLVGSESLKKGSLDQRVDRKGADFLAQRAASLVPIDAAAIDGIVGLRPRVANTHATPATAANRDALQQSRAFARRASVARLVAGDILRHSPLVGHELLPADVTRVSRLQATRPIRERHFDGSRHRPRAASARVLLPPTVNIRPSIGGILKNMANPRAVRVPPDHFMRDGPSTGRTGKGKPLARKNRITPRALCSSLNLAKTNCSRA